MQESSAPRSRKIKAGSPAFTLIEALVAMAVLMLLVVLLLSMVSQGTRIWQITNAQKSSREVSRTILDRISQDLESAVFPLDAARAGGFGFFVNPLSLPEYNNPSAAFWQAGLPGDRGSSGDIVDVGYFVRWHTTNGVARGTLCRLEIPASSPDSYARSTLASKFNKELVDSYAPGLGDQNYKSSPTAFKGLLADNVLGLWITVATNATGPLLSTYDSTTVTSYPTYADVAIAVVDGAVANRITDSSMITSCYQGTNTAAFLDALPPEIRPGVQIYQTRVQILTER